MLIQKQDATQKSNSENCTVWEYEYPSEQFGLATALINGRYPEEKRAVNLECEQIYYVSSGSGIIHSEKGEFNVQTGDLYFFEKGEIYWIEGHELIVVLVNVPKWSYEQYKIVD